MKIGHLIIFTQTQQQKQASGYNPSVSLAADSPLYTRGRSGWRKAIRTGGWRKAIRTKIGGYRYCVSPNLYCQYCRTLQRTNSVRECINVHLKYHRSGTCNYDYLKRCNDREKATTGK